jgi:hypothetical protein
MSELILTIGPGHAHNELLSWTLNQSSYSVNHYKPQWQLYPGPFGTFIRHDDGWNMVDYPKFADVYDYEIRQGNENDHVEEHHIEKLRDEVCDIFSLMNKTSVYINCLNVIEGVNFAKECGVDTATAILDLPNSKYRSHYVQMEFSIGAASSKDYSNVQFDLPSACYWLTKKHRQQMNDILPCDASCKANINKILSDDKEEFDEEMRRIMVDSHMNRASESKEYRSDTFKRLQYFKFINQPIHPLMKQINEMSWDDILEESQKTLT